MTIIKIVDLIKKELIGKNIKYVQKVVFITTPKTYITYKNGTTIAQQKQGKNIIYKTKYIGIGKHTILNIQKIKDVVPDIGDNDATFKMILENNDEIYFDALSELKIIGNNLLMFN